LVKQTFEQAGECVQPLPPVDRHALEHIGELRPCSQGDAGDAQPWIDDIGRKAHELAAVVEFGQNLGDGLLRAKGCAPAQILVVEVQDALHRDIAAQRFGKAAQQHRLDHQLRAPGHVTFHAVDFRNQGRQPLVVGLLDSEQFLVARAAGEAL